MNRSVVAKVGGSLFDWGELRQRLNTWIERQGETKILLLGGGGDLADAIRKLHQTHHLPELTSHWLAIRTMSVNARFLGELLKIPVIDSLSNWKSNAALDPLALLLADEGQPGALPHTWKVTSDSIAGRVAELAHASLTLLKSADQPDLRDWESIALAGYVDRHFPMIARAVNGEVSCVNLRNVRE